MRLHSHATAADKRRYAATLDSLTATGRTYVTSVLLKSNLLGVKLSRIGAEQPLRHKNGILAMKSEVDHLSTKFIIECMEAGEDLFFKGFPTPPSTVDWSDDRCEQESGLWLSMTYIRLGWFNGRDKNQKLADELLE